MEDLRSGQLLVAKYVLKLVDRVSAIADQLVVLELQQKILVKNVGAINAAMDDLRKSVRRQTNRLDRRRPLK